MFFAIDLEPRVAPDHPLRPIKRMVDEELRRMTQSFAAAYCAGGRASVPPERILKAMLLQAIYSIRSERELCRRIETDLLFRWFLDMDPAEDAFHHTVFPHNRERLEHHGFVQRFFDGVVRTIREAGLASDDHFTVDGTLIQSHASLKSLKRIEREAALSMLEDLRRRRRREPLTLGADKGYDSGDFLVELGRREIGAHVAVRAGPIEPRDEGSWARWLTRHGVLKGHFHLSQRKRKLVEEAVGWIKKVAGMSRARHVERWKIKQHVTMAAAAAYYLARARKLLASG
ncbi:MAG: transposase [Phycisphaerales bacterium]